MNTNSLKTFITYVEPILATCSSGDKFQFDLNGYFVADQVDNSACKLVLDLAVGLKNSWGK